MDTETIKPVRQLWVDELLVKIYQTRQEMGVAAAKETLQEISRLASESDTIRMVFAAAPSQNEYLESLAAYKDYPWEKVDAFHMDEYIGLPADHPQLFARYLKLRLFDRLPFRSIHTIDPEPGDPWKTARAYEKKILEKPPDIVAMGIGENTHIAFNDPPVADFKDPLMVKIIELEQACKQQQVNDGCFQSLDQVPATAITLTIPALMAGKKLFCMVPGTRKSKAVYLILTEKISERHPASILRRHKSATLFLDLDAAQMIM